MISKTNFNGKLLLPEISMAILQVQVRNTLERNRKSNDIHFELSRGFLFLHNDDQNLTKRPTSTIPNIPEKIPTNSRNTSPHATNTMQNKRPLVCTTGNYLKNFIPKRFSSRQPWLC